MSRKKLLLALPIVGAAAVCVASLALGPARDERASARTTRPVVPNAPVAARDVATLPQPQATETTTSCVPSPVVSAEPDVPSPARERALEALRSRCGGLELARGANGDVIFLLGGLSGLSPLDPADVAKGFLRDHAAVWGIGDVDRDLALDTPGSVLSPDDCGTTHARFHQVVSGVPLLRHDLAVHMDLSGAVTAVSGEFDPGAVAASIAPVPTVTLDRAIAAVRLDAGGPLSKDPTSSLVAWRGEDGVRLVWAIEASSIAGGWSREYLVDAHGGTIVRREDRTLSEVGSGMTPRGVQVPLQMRRGRDGQWRLADRSTRTPIETFSLYDFPSQDGEELDAAAGQVGVDDASADADGTWTESWQASDAAAHWNMRRTIDFWRDTMGRASWDGANAEVLVGVHAILGGTPNNAVSFLDGVHCFGDGDGRMMRSLTSIDCVAHEFGHTVLQSCAQLDMGGEQVGLHEHFADAWGAFTERRVGNERGAHNWLVGEEVVVGRRRALRDMSNPPSLGRRNLHHMSQFSPWIDGHLTSQILSKWLYLWVHGGRHSRSRVTVTGMQPSMGEDQAFGTAEQAYYRAMRRYLPHSATFHSFRLALLASIRDVAGASSTAYTEALSAFGAIGLQ